VVAASAGGRGLRRQTFFRARLRRRQTTCLWDFEAHVTSFGRLRPTATSSGPAAGHGGDGYPFKAAPIEPGPLGVGTTWASATTPGPHRLTPPTATVSTSCSVSATILWLPGPGRAANIDDLIMQLQLNPVNWIHADERRGHFFWLDFDAGRAVATQTAGRAGSASNPDGPGRHHRPAT